MFCSIIIPTIGRASLARAVNSVLDQSLVEAAFEVIVVNDSSQALAPEAWQQAENVTILATNRRERSVARNCGAAAARGQYLYFLDDDDWLLPGALAAFWQLAQQAPEAAWLHGGIRVMGDGRGDSHGDYRGDYHDENGDENGRILSETNSGVQGACLAQIMGGAWVPIQSSIIRAGDFFAVGGYSPFVRGTEDQDLCRRIAAQGQLANTTTPVACLFRGADWQTSTDYGRAAEDTRLSRDEMVNQPGTFGNMIASAGTGYWYGRVVHIYLSLALWQWRQQRFFTAASRALYGGLALLHAAAYWSDPDFRQALRDHHVPGSLHFIQLGWEQSDR